MPNNGAPSRTTDVRYASDQMMVELCQRLVESNLVTRAQIDDLNTKKVFTDEPLDRLLIKEGLVSEEDVLAVLADLSHIPFHPIRDFNIAADISRHFPARAALRFQVVPIKFDQGVLTLATFRVPDISMVDSIRMLVGCVLEWVMCSQYDITNSIKHFYGIGAESIGALIESRPQDDLETLGKDLAADSDPGIIQFINKIIFEAIKINATDIHIEPFETYLSLRYRVDGVLQDIPLPQGIHKLRRSIVSCVKIMAQMNISERRKPHDGRIKVNIGKEEFDLRVSVLPTRFGETVALRILNREAMFIDLEKLGLLDYQLPILKQLSELPHGIILVTGPTGSGKTTTLYALLSRLNTKADKIITVEDPVEYQMQGISQIQVHSNIGLTFDTILRSILRHDPDIILIGEIRDAETAEIAVRSSLTGHLVFSTLHTNDAASAITRLIDMGIEPYLVSSCLEGVVAQRLVRRTCTACRRPTVLDPVILEEIAGMFPPPRIQNAVFYQHHGCPSCGFTGFKGRIAIFEILVIDEIIRGLIAHQKTSTEIRNAAIANGLITLRQDGWVRVLEGMTTVDEVLRVARKIEFSYKPPSQ